VDYDALRDMVEGLLQTFGSITSLRVTSGRVVNPTDGSVVSAGTVALHDVSLVSLTPESLASARALYALGGGQRFGTRTLVMVCRTAVPKEGDELWAEDAWRVLGPVSPVAPDMSTPVCYRTSLAL
jgi:hypothetical protein